MAADQTSLEELIKDLPKGAFWVTGTFIRELIAAVLADRVNGIENFDETPGPKGRSFTGGGGRGGSGGPGTVEIVFEDNSDGVLKKATFAVTNLRAADDL